MLWEPGTPKPIWEGLRGPGLRKILSGDVSRTAMSPFPCTPAPLTLRLLAVARKSRRESGCLLLGGRKEKEKGWRREFWGSREVCCQGFTKRTLLLSKEKKKVELGLGVWGQEKGREMHILGEAHGIAILFQSFTLISTNGVGYYHLFIVKGYEPYGGKSFLFIEGPPRMTTGPGHGWHVPPCSASSGFKPTASCSMWTVAACLSVYPSRPNGQWLCFGFCVSFISSCAMHA